MAEFTDEQLDRDWKPSGRRPQSTIARSFSAELMDIFRIENSVADLDNQVDKRKQAVNSQSNELEALEARIREMEDRLRRSRQATARRPIPQQQAPAHTTSQQENVSPPSVPKDLPEVPEKSRSRPATSRNAQQAHSSGALPPTPVASEGEYEVIDRADLDDD